MTREQASRAARSVVVAMREARYVVEKDDGSFATCSPELYAEASAAGAQLTIVERYRYGTTGAEVVA